MVESQLHQELLISPAATDEIQVDKADEIIALVCVLKPQLNMDDPATKLAVNKASLEIAKAGTKPFKMRPGKYLKMPRKLADWHVGKAKTYAAENPLMLVVKTLEELNSVGKAPSLSYRERLLMQAKKENLITRDEDAENVSDTELAGLLSKAPQK